MKLLNMNDVASLLRVSRRTVSRLRSRGDLPAPVEVSAGIVRWRAADLKEYIACLKSRMRRPARA